MIRAVALNLVDDGSPRGAFEAATETVTQVMARVRSVRQSEFYAAQNAGLQPEVIFILANYAEYNRQKFIEWDGVRYRVLRTYVDGDAIEITCSREENQ